MCVPTAECALACTGLCALGLLAGFWAGLLCGRRHQRREVQLLRDELLALHGARKTCRVSSGGPMSDDGCGALGTFTSPVIEEGAIVNETLRYMWPFLSSFIVAELRGRIEPALQVAMPEALRGIRFSETKCHLGDTPIQILKLESKTWERRFANGDRHTNVRAMAEVMLDGNCEIELMIPNVGENVLGSWALFGTRVGVSNLKLHGKVVMELSNIIPRPPFAAGVVFYFTNPPHLDMTLIGDFGGILNVSIIKQKILGIVATQLAGMMVLPKRVVVPLAPVDDIFRLLAPRPEGILRVAVMEARNLPEAALAGHRICPYVRIVFGDVDWCSAEKPGERSPAWGEESLVDLTVHDRHAQQLRISIFQSEQSLIWGRSQGACLGQAIVRAEHLITGPQTSWWRLDPLNPDGSDRDADDPDHFTNKPFRSARLRRLSHRRGSKAVTARPSFRRSQTSVQSDLEPEEVEGDGAFVKLHIEWRPYSADGTEASRLMRHKPVWTLGRSRQGFIGKLLVGVHSATDLPCHSVPYWCAASVRSTETGTAKTKKTLRVEGVLKACPGGDDGLETAHTVEAKWARPFFFHLGELQRCSVDVSVHQGGYKADSGTLVGTLQYDIEELCQQPHLEKVLEAPLCPGEGAAPPGDTGERAEAAGVANGAARPRARVVLKLWLLKPSLRHL